MRYGHTLVTPGVYRRTANCDFNVQPPLRTCNTYWNGDEAIKEHGIDTLLMGMASQIAEREDNIIVEVMSVSALC